MNRLSNCCCHCMQQPVASLMEFGKQVSATVTKSLEAVSRLPSICFQTIQSGQPKENDVLCCCSCLKSLKPVDSLTELGGRSSAIAAALLKTSVISVQPARLASVAGIYELKQDPVSSEVETLQASVLSSALKAWQEACRDKVTLELYYSSLAESAEQLVQFFPKEVLEELERLIDTSDDVCSIARLLEKCVKVIPSAKILPLFQKVHIKARICSYPSAALSYLACGLASINPSEALSIAHEIHEPHWRLVNWEWSALIKIAAALLFTNPEEAFKMISNGIKELRYKQSAYQALLQSCSLLDQKTARPHIERIHREAEECLCQAEKDLAEGKRVGESAYHVPYLRDDLRYEVSVAYVDSDLFSEALQSFEQPISDRWMRIRAQLYFIQKHGEKHRSEMTNFMGDLDQIAEELLSNPHSGFSENLSEKLMNVFIRLNELEKAENFIGRIKDSMLKIKMLTVLAETHKPTNSVKSVQLLEQALELVPPVSHTRARASAVGLLTEIAYQYASIDCEKAREVISLAEEVVVKVGLQHFHAAAVMHALVKAYNLIDSSYALKLLQDYQVFVKPVIRAELLLKIHAYLPYAAPVEPSQKSTLLHEHVPLKNLQLL